MKTHTAMPPPRRNYGVGPFDPGWRPDHPPAAPPASRPPATYAPPPDYGTARVPGDHQRAADATVPPSPPPPPPSHAQRQIDDGVPVETRRWADLRKQVVFRSKRLNMGHMIEADQRYGHRDALGPHGVMLFFVTDAPAEPHGYKLHTAYRLWLASPDSNDLPRLLADLAEVAADNIAHSAAAGRPWHPLGPEGSMVNGGDMTLPNDATYVGVGITTLDSDQGRWYQVAHTLRDLPANGRRLSVFDLPGQCYALLTDGTTLHVNRDPHARLGVDGIRCNKTLDPDRITYYNPHEHLTEQGDDATRNVWRQLGALHHTLTAHLLARQQA